MSDRIPAEIREDWKRARRLAWWTVGWMVSIVVVMGLTMGSSQAMKTAWIEDVLSIVPAIVFLISTQLELKAPTRRFPYGFHRVHSLAFLISAVALTAVGATLLIESATTLLMREHATVPPVQLFGENIWLGWLMIGALVYSVVPPFILGRMKLPLSKRLQDAVLFTDAEAQKADWMTGLAGVAGVLGIGLGQWWADAAAAGIIAFSILRDGIGALRTATAELIDGLPRRLGRSEVAPDAEQLLQHLKAHYPGDDVRLRETGRYIHAQVYGVEPEHSVDLKALWPGPAERSWRFAQLSFVPVEDEEM